MYYHKSDLKEKFSQQSDLKADLKADQQSDQKAIKADQRSYPKAADHRKSRQIGNPEQWEGISFRGETCLILAGPGSGKTFVLVRHIWYLTRYLRVPASSILVLTFSKAAALQMQSRFRKLEEAESRKSTGNRSEGKEAGAGRAFEAGQVMTGTPDKAEVNRTENTADGKGAGGPVVFGTFHSVFYHILKASSSNPPRIIPAKVRQKLLRTLAETYLVESGAYDERLEQQLDREISRRKTRGEIGLGPETQPTGQRGRQETVWPAEQKTIQETVQSAAQEDRQKTAQPAEQEDRQETVQPAGQEDRRKTAPSAAQGERCKTEGRDKAVPTAVRQAAQEEVSMEAACRHYEAFLRENHYLDFDDMILQCRRLLLERPEVRRRWQQKFSCILIDEFQDISPLQYETVRLLLRDDGCGLPPTHLFCVGDDDQSIYGFRGSDPAMMRKLCEDQPETRLIRLKLNYRSGWQIIDAAARVIRENGNRIPKKQKAGRSFSSVVELVPAINEADEYLKIKELLQAKIGSTAVIFRTHLQAEGLIRFLEEEGIPFRARGHGSDARGRSVRERAACQTIYEDVAAYMRLSEEYRQGYLLRRDLFQVMNKPVRYLTREAFPEEVIRLPAYGQLWQLSSWQILMKDLSTLSWLSPAYFLRYLFLTMGYETYVREQIPTELQSVAKEAVEEIRAAAPLHTDRVEFFHWLAGEHKGQNATVKLVTGEHKGQNATVKLVTGEHKGQNATVKLVTGEHEELNVEARSLTGWREEQNATIRSFSGKQEALPLSRESRLPLQVIVPEQDKHDAEVQIVTMHASKGLEYDTVILPDLNEGVIPSRKAVGEEGIEEERRLLYVAMTRARSRLVLMYIRGPKENPRLPSRFLHCLGVRDWID